MSDDDDRPNGLLIGRVTIEKYATQDDVIIWVETDTGSGDELYLVDALGMLEFAKQHTWASRVDGDEEDA